MSLGHLPSGSYVRSPPGWEPPPLPSRLVGAVNRAGTGSLEGNAQWGGLTAWSTDLDGFTAGHGLGARLTHAFLPTEGHLVSNGERLPVRGVREKFNTPFLRYSVSIGGLITGAQHSLVTHTARLPEQQANSSAVHRARLTNPLSEGQDWTRGPT